MPISVFSKAGTFRSFSVIPLLALLSLFVSLPALAQSQSCPAQGTVLFPGVEGGALADSLIAHYKTGTVLSYDAARERMYGDIDNTDGYVTGVYTGYRGAIDPSAGNYRGQANEVQINAEHTWPQSKGATEGTLGHSDMHMLHPAYGPANSSRSNDPYIDIPDDETDGWWRFDRQSTSPDPDSIDYYSERRDSHPSSKYDGSWEPREFFKGDAARSVFYFYTMYREQADEADPDFFDVQKDYLRSWNALDSVSTTEYNRTCAIAPYQDDKVNPFVIDPTLVNRLYFPGQKNTPVVQFATNAITLDENRGSYSVEITMQNANADTATTVRFSYSGGSATAGADFNQPQDQTLTFEAGQNASHTITLELLNDDESEQSENILFSLSGIEGPDGAVIGLNDTIDITIRDDDGNAPQQVWINEFHYDNDGTDTGEFVELAAAAEFADLSAITLTLYNGSNGSVYNSISGDNFTRGASENGITLYYLELPSNGIQNGSPDGMSLDRDGTLIQFISYEGTMTPEEGPAAGFESEDVGATESNNSPLSSSVSLTGNGSQYTDFTWVQTDNSSMGAVNDGQSFETGTSAEDEDSLPAGIAMDQNYPNPFNPVTQIPVSLNQASDVSLSIYNSAGMKISEVYSGKLSAGTHTFTFNAGNLSSGIYFYRLNTDGGSFVKKMVLLK